MTNKLATISRGLFKIYNRANVKKDENIITQSGVKFYHYSREIITFYSSPFSKEILKAPITMVLVPIAQEVLVSIVDSIDHEKKLNTRCYVMTII